MAGPFTFVVGSFDCSEFVRVNPGDGFTPYPEGVLEPIIAESPLAEGGRLALLDSHVAERRVPLYLNKADPTQLRALEQALNRELNKSSIRVEWRSPVSTDSTYWDIEAGVFEADYSLRHDAQGWLAGVLRLWTQPYGHTATERVIATAAGTGPLLTVPIPTALSGDAPGLLDVRVNAGSYVPSSGRVVALAVAAHPSHIAQFPAASIGDRMSGAALTGASGALGSQYLGLPVGPTGASGLAAKVELFTASAYQGPLRLFGLARSKLNDGVALYLTDPFGNRIGPTALATVSESWGLLDLGVYRMPSPPGRPTQLKLPLIAGGLAGTAYEGGMVGSPGLHLGGVFALPEEQTVLVADLGAAPTTVAGDDLDSVNANLALTGLGDDHGNTWQLGRAQSQASNSMFLSKSGYAYPFASYRSANYIDRAVQDSISVAEIAENAVASGYITVRRDVDASGYIDAMYQHHPSRILSLLSVVAGATTLHASQALASLAIVDHHYLSLRTVGGQGVVTLRRKDGATIVLAGGAGVLVASIGASHANLNVLGNPGIGAIGLSAQNTQLRRVYDFSVQSIPSSPLSAKDQYRFDGPNEQLTRAPSGADITGLLSGQARGRMPQAPAPTTAQVIALLAPVDQGPANDLLSVEIRDRERFRFAR
jgi:hypothetical protein